MAKKSPEPDMAGAEAPVAPAPPRPMFDDSDPLVYVRGLGNDLTPHRVSSGKARRITVDGHPCEHTGETDDGTWIYQMLSF